MRITISLFLIALASFAASCKKENQPAVKGQPFIPVDMMGFMPTKSVNIYAFGTLLPGYDGAFTACRVLGRGYDTAGIERVYSRSWQTALVVIRTPPQQNATLPDRIFVNDTEVGGWQYIGDESSFWYVHKDSVPVWHEGAANQWKATGNLFIPQFSIGINGEYPVFSGAIPDSIPINKEFLFVFGPSNISNADSAFVLLYNNGNVLGSKCINSSGFATISKPAMARFKAQGTTIGSPPNAPDGIIFNGNGYMLVVLFRTEEKKISGKKYAFVQQSIFFKPVQFY